MNSNNDFVADYSSEIASTRKSVRPVLKLHYGQKGDFSMKDKVGGLNRKEKECCNRATD